MPSFPVFETLDTSLSNDGVLTVALNRPKKMNAMNMQFFKDVTKCFNRVRDNQEDIRVVLLIGNGKVFSAGLDLRSPPLPPAQKNKEMGRKVNNAIEFIKMLQESNNAVANCQKPVICLMHGVTYGGAVDLSSACDVRWCSEDVRFSIKEVDIGICADLGTMARVPKIVGNNSLFRELCYTGREFGAKEALSFGYVSRVLPSEEEMLKQGRKLASEIAAKSPMAIRGIKEMAEYAQNHSVEDCNNYVALWNAAQLQGSDFKIAVMSFLQKKKPVFAKL